MIPVRLTLLLICVLALLLLIVGNPDPAPVNFLFWTGEFEQYKIIIGSAAFGALFTLLYTSQARYLKRIRSRFK